MAMSLAQATLFSRTSLFLSRNGLRSFTFCIPFSSSSVASTSLPSDKLHRNKWRQPVASVLELGGLKIGREGNFDTPLALISLFYHLGCSPFFFFFVLTMFCIVVPLKLFYLILHSYNWLASKL
jgi:hypothetical protein